MECNEPAFNSLFSLLRRFDFDEEDELEEPEDDF